jgi:PleD family two-component response regulator
MDEFQHRCSGFRLNVLGIVLTGSHQSLMYKLLQALDVAVASFPENGNTGEALLRKADSALYQAKQQGRDRVVIA